MTLPPPPPEVPVCTSLDGLAPRLAAAWQCVEAAMRRAGFDPKIAETTRTDEREAYLYGFGRDYDDGRGIVTNASTADHSWHKFGLAIDVISASRGWDAPDAFWNGLRAAAEDEGLVSGAAWHMKDRPHVQWGAPMRVSPSPIAAALARQGGNPAVWRVVGAGA